MLYYRRPKKPKKPWRKPTKGYERKAIYVKDGYWDHVIEISKTKKMTITEIMNQLLKALIDAQNK